MLLYAGDFDPSGEDVDRDLVERTGCLESTSSGSRSTPSRSATALPVNPGKATDSRAAGFIGRHGALVQVELDALDPDACAACSKPPSTPTGTRPHTRRSADTERRHQQDRLYEVARSVR